MATTTSPSRTTGTTVGAALAFMPLRTLFRVAPIVFFDRNGRAA